MKIFASITQKYTCEVVRRKSFYALHSLRISMKIFASMIRKFAFHTNAPLCGVCNMKIFTNITKKYVRVILRRENFCVSPTITKTHYARRGKHEDFCKHEKNICYPYINAPHSRGDIIKIFADMKKNIYVPFTNAPRWQKGNMKIFANITKNIFAVNFTPSYKRAVFAWDNVKNFYKHNKKMCAVLGFENFCVPRLASRCVA